ncbi:hypothetical protein [Thalassospira sp.]|uniref:hypothetical protein n=1 Tax=Thalassospira sp. TaxID=1912094 RepID=UPI001B1CFBEA|nr:hypothetical protein [Thalassospira sp.]MBO6805970.1 hypothetical protein [Thalassospira sp.]
MNYEIVELDWSQGVVALKEDLSAVGQRVLDGNIVILSKVFSEPLMDQCKRALLDWQASNAPTNPNRLATGESWWRRDVNSPSKTSHLFETFCLVFSDHNSGSLEVLKEVFDQMGEIWESLLPEFRKANPEKPGAQLRPQAIHYPKGGGFFDWHVHDIAPQGIGLIVGLSKQGRDFETGGTIFRDNTGEVDTSDIHDIGDICLFRYDLEHAVGVVDPEYDLEWGATGRWTMVLPMM